MNKTPVIGFVAACSGTGKTTLIRKIIKGLQERGFRVAVIKHGEHLDLPPRHKDSSLFLEEGAEISLISTPGGWMMTGTPEVEATLEELVEKLEPYQFDLILVEGYKDVKQPKIELHRKVLHQGLVCPEDELIAVVSDDEINIKRPRFVFEDITGILSFIINYLKGERYERD